MSGATIYLKSSDIILGQFCSVSRFLFVMPRYSISNIFSYLSLFQDILKSIFKNVQCNRRYGCIEIESVTSFSFSPRMLHTSTKVESVDFLSSCFQVFLAECIGPLLIYLLFYFRVPYIYSHNYAFTSSPHPVVRSVEK